MARLGSKDRGLFERPQGSGIWWIRYVDGSGLEHREKIGRKGLARQVYNKRKTEIREAKYFPPKRERVVLFDEIAEDFLAYSRQAKRSHEEDEERMRRLHQYFDGRPADQITAEEIENFKFELAAERAPATVNRHLALLKSTFNRAIKSGKCASNPVNKISFLKENNIRVRYLSNVEEKKLLSALPNYLRPLATVAMHTGLRQSELLNLRWADVDLAAHVLVVNQAKSGEGRRIPFNSKVHESFLGVKNGKSQKRKKKVKKFADAGYVFRSKEGGPFLNLRRAWGAAVKRAKIADFRFHDLRHTFASRLVMKGVDLYTVQILLGHKTAAMVQRYAHLSPGHLRQAVEKLAPSAGPKRVRATG